MATDSYVVVHGRVLAPGRVAAGAYTARLRTAKEQTKGWADQNSASANGRSAAPLVVWTTTQVAAAITIDACRVLTALSASPYCRQTQGTIGDN